MAAGGLDVLVPPGKELVEAGADVVMWACTSGSFIGGLEWTRQQAKGLSAALGRPAASTTLSVLAGLKHLGAQKADLLGSYPEPIVKVLQASIEQSGFPVENVIALGAPDGKATFALDMCAAGERFAQMTKGSRNPVVIPDTAANTLNLLTRLEDILDRPVVTAVGATLWYGLVLLGLRPHLPDAGTLFAGQRWDLQAAE